VVTWSLEPFLSASRLVSPRMSICCVDGMEESVQNGIELKELFVECKNI